MEDKWPMHPIFRTFIATVLASLALASTAQAATPTLLSVGQQDRHVTGTFYAPTDDVTVYVASKPDRATDGKFLSENLKDIDFLTAEERANGAWLDSDQLDPGTYYVMLRATSYATDCLDCINGFSEVLTLAVPKPAHRFRATVEGGFVASFRLFVTKAGEDVPYRLCWTKARGRRKCVRGRVDGSDWNDTESDIIFLTRSDLKLGKRQRRTTFRWYVGGRKVASKRIRVSR